MKKFLFFTFFLMFSFLAFAQEIKEEAWLSKNADQPYIALANEYQVTLKPDWSYEETYHSRIKIQKDTGKELQQWPIYYNKSRDAISDIVARVENPDGHQVTATDIQDLPVYKDLDAYSDMHMKLVSLPEVSVGSIIDVTVRSSTTRKEIPNHYWAEVLYPAIPTQHAKHVFIIPDDKPVRFKSYKMAYQPTIEKSNGRTIYTMVFDETNPIPDQETLMPPMQEVLGAMYLSSMDDWKIVADWYRDLVNKKTIDDSQITLKALEVVKGKTLQKDKARAILEYIQDNYQYVPLNFGDNTVDPNSTTTVFKNQYGDSKDIALLTRQLFQIVGIEINICLLSEEFSGNPQSGLPNPNVFSHVILQAKLDGKDYFIDPLLRGFDIGEYPANYENGYVLIIDSESYRFDNLPNTPEDRRTLLSEADVNIFNSGAADYRVHVKLPIEASQSFRQTWLSSSNEDKDKFFKNLQGNFAKSGQMIDHKVSGVENRYGPVEFNLRYHSDDAYPIVNDMILIKEETQSDLPDFSAEKRDHPIFVSINSLIKNVNTYHIPDQFKVNFLPQSYTMSIDFMDVEVDYQNKENFIEITSNYHTKRCTIPAERYGQLKNFAKDLFKKNDQYIVLKKSSEPEPTGEAKEAVKKPIEGK